MTNPNPSLNYLPLSGSSRLAFFLLTTRYPLPATFR